MDDPMTPMLESAAATHELFRTYKAAGFTDSAALYLTGVVVAGVSQRTMEAQALRDAEEAAAAQLQVQPMIRFFCAVCGGDLVEVNGQLICPNHPPAAGGPAMGSLGLARDVVWPTEIPDDPNTQPGG